MHSVYRLAAGTYTVSFDFRNGLSPTFESGSNFPDTFFVSLYFMDDTNTFNIDLNEFAASLILMDLDYAGAFNVAGVIGASDKGPEWDHFSGSFTVTNLYAALAFEFNDLNGIDNDSQVRIDNVSIVPEPAAWALCAIGAALLILRRRKIAGRWACAIVMFAASTAYSGGPIPQDVSDVCLITTTNERSTLNRATGEVTTTLDARIYNLGNRTILSPFHVAVNLSTGPVNVVGALGGTNLPPYFTFYFDLSSSLPGGLLRNSEFVSLSLTFKRRREVQFNYSLVPYGALQPESPPVLFVSPLSYTVTEGQVLQISVNATDADAGDIVVLSATPLVSNMTFAVTNDNPASGTLRFAPLFNQEGVYSVMFRARDPKG